MTVETQYTPTEGTLLIIQRFLESLSQIVTGCLCFKNCSGVGESEVFQKYGVTIILGVYIYHLRKTAFSSLHAS